jgi:hypothetical protein
MCLYIAIQAISHLLSQFFLRNKHHFFITNLRFMINPALPISWQSWLQLVGSWPVFLGATNQFWVRGILKFPANCRSL